MSKILQEIVALERELYVTNRPDGRKPNVTPTPKWLAEKVETSRRKAKLSTCPKCGAGILTGDDHDRCAMTARVDPTPVDPIVEVAAVLAGRQSYDLIRGALYARTPDHYRQHRYPVLLDHVCATATEGVLF